jgi:hypothetical protein
VNLNHKLSAIFTNRVLVKKECIKETLLIWRVWTKLIKEFWRNKTNNLRTQKIYSNQLIFFPNQFNVFSFTCLDSNRIKQINFFSIRYQFHVIQNRSSKTQTKPLCLSTFSCFNSDNFLTYISTFSMSKCIIRNTQLY